MPTVVNYYELQTAKALVKEFTQTPIFIGTATKQVVVPMEPGVFSLAIPKAEDGTVFNESIIEGKFRYWKIFGEGEISLIAPGRKSIALSGPDLSYHSTRADLKICNLFILGEDGIIFSTPIDSADFTVIDGHFYIRDLHLLIALMGSINVGQQCVLAYPKETTEFDYTITENVISIAPFPFQLEASNLNTMISSEYSFYFDVKDFRWGRYNSDDELPPEFAYTPHNKLGLIAHYHRKNTKTDMTLYSVPRESLISMEAVLSELILDPYKYGYAIVPLWSDSDVANVISAYVQSIESHRIGFQVTYLVHKPPVEKELFGKNVSVRATHYEWVPTL